MAKYKLGCIKDTYDHRDFELVFAGTDYPVSMDLRKTCPPVFNQGELGSCTANAIANALRFIDKKQGKDLGAFSRLFIYFNERVMENTVKQDAGAMIRDGIKSVANQGACLEKQWPYKPEKFAVKPPDKCYTEAVKYEALTYKRLAQTESQLKTCLASGIPFVFGIQVYDSFMTDTVAKTGVVPMPVNGEQLQGGHAVLCVGYTKDGYFIAMNSWGTGWGQKGFFLIPVKYLLDTNLTSDIWAIQTAKD